MSLIDEALKRAELEAARRDGLRSGTYPWVPEQTPKPRRRWAAVAAVVVIAAAAGGGAWWLSKRSARGPGGSGPQVRTSPSKIQNPKSKIDMETVEVLPPPVGLPSRVLSRGAGETPTIGEARQAPPAAASDVAEVHAPRSAQSRPGGAAVENKPPSKGSAEGKTYVGEVKLPDGAKIELGGIVYSDANPVALINDHVLGPGAVVEEFTIVSIQPDRVELKGRGTTIFLVVK
jgi:hypothetical protein